MGPAGEAHRAVLSEVGPRGAVPAGGDAAGPRQEAGFHAQAMGSVTRYLVTAGQGGEHYYGRAGVA